MLRNSIIVPKGIRYISDWKEYSLENYAFPHILNKTLTGCGFTEYCIRNNLNMVILSPRRLLLENKQKQHLADPWVYYAKNEVEKLVEYERDISISKKTGFVEIIETSDKIKEKQEKLMIFRDGIKNHITNCMSNNAPCKILVTYDSFRHVKDILKSFGVLDQFYIVIDEFQSILIDARFKSGTEIELLNSLQDIQRLCFISATPMLDEYLERLDEFKNLPYYQLDWEAEDPNRVKRPQLNIKFISRGLNEELGKTVKEYLSGSYERRISLSSTGEPIEIYSKEAVFFLNSVKGICNAIVSNKLLPWQCNILCARTVENEKKVKLAFDTVFRKLYPDDKSKRMNKLGLTAIGTIPVQGESHKMFTFCTRTVYLGADFYSDNARTFIYSDANIECLSVDISMDLEQILGRQRLDINPWKDSAELIIKTTDKALTREDFNRIIEDKITSTKNLLDIYNGPVLDKRQRHDLAVKYEKDAVNSAYKDDYVAVNRHSGSDLKPVFNNIMLVSEQRAFDIQQVDYRDRFTVFNAIKEIGLGSTTESIIECANEFNSRTAISDKLMYLQEAEIRLGADQMPSFLEYIPKKYKDYYLVFGTARIKALKYREADLLREWEKIKHNSESKDKLIEEIYNNFEVGKKYSKAWIKEKLREIYYNCGFNSTPKASDLDKYFNMKPCLVTNKEAKKRDNGFEIISKK